MTLLRRFRLDEEGPTAVEYAVMLALIIVVCIISIRAIGTSRLKDNDNGPAVVGSPQGAVAKQFLIILSAGPSPKHPLIVVADDVDKANAIGRRIAEKSDMNVLSVEELSN
jgi:pilus assembly protein Flp/PilA